MNFTRRSFVKIMAIASGLFFLGTKSQAADKVPDGYEHATLADPIPKAMKYVESAEAGGPLRTDKTAYCRNCTQYGKTHKEFVHSKDGKVATCEIFVKGKGKQFVKSGGWCLGYQKDPKVS